MGRRWESAARAGKIRCPDMKRIDADFVSLYVLLCEVEEGMVLPRCCREKWPRNQSLSLSVVEVFGRLPARILER